MQSHQLRFLAIVATLLSGIAFMAAGISACGCYGPATCTVDVHLCSGDASQYENCVCDCCAACLTCAQLFGGCAAIRVQEIESSFDIPSYYVVDQAIAPTSLNNSRALFNPCVDPELPEGLSLTQDQTTFNWVLSGTPTQVQPAREYTVLFKGPTSNEITKDGVHYQGYRSTTEH
eukprot:GEZU01024263.1.p1 GENE.GEZU01024263.1~~GEZU01024263.1.p1  ORF type:complete len:175 (-),score=35.37 GEZU01024263.1:351-875(-)